MNRVSTAHTPPHAGGTSPSRSGQPRGFSLAVVILLFGNLAVTLCNLLRDVAVAASLGSSRRADYFFLAISIPVLVISVAGGSYRSVVVPFLVRRAASAHDYFRAAAARLTWLNVTGVAIVSGLGAIALALGYALTSEMGSYGTGPNLLGVMLLVIPMYTLSGFVEMSQGVLQACGSLLLPNLNRAALPAGVTVAAVWLGATAGIAGLVLGGTVGALIGAFGIAAQLARHG